jgi:site-specific DNA-methyltransferase (adenine-specific)
VDEGAGGHPIDRRGARHAENRFYISKPRKAETNKGLRGRPKTLTRGAGWTKSEHENPHESKKPVDLMERLVRYACPEGGLVLDPFCGSGTTGVACANVGRRFIGVERELDYAEVAALRVTDAEGQPPPPAA